MRKNGRSRTPFSLTPCLLPCSATQDITPLYIIFAACLSRVSSLPPRSQAQVRSSRSSWSSKALITCPLAVSAAPLPAPDKAQPSSGGGYGHWPSNEDSPAAQPFSGGGYGHWPDNGSSDPATPSSGVDTATGRPTTEPQTLSHRREAGTVIGLPMAVCPELSPPPAAATAIGHPTRDPLARNLRRAEAMATGLQMRVLLAPSLLPEAGTVIGRPTTPLLVPNLHRVAVTVIGRRTIRLLPQLSRRRAEDTVTGRTPLRTRKPRR